MKQKLTPKQALFVKEYLVDFNATQAAIRAGYSQKTAQRIGSENLSKPLIQNAIQEAQNQREQRLDISVDRIEAEIAKIAFANISDIAQWSPGAVTLKPVEELSREVTDTIHEISETQVGLKVKQYDKLKALELLGRRHGMFTDKVEHSGEIQNTVDPVAVVDAIRRKYADN